MNTNAPMDLNPSFQSFFPLSLSSSSPSSHQQLQQQQKAMIHEIKMQKALEKFNKETEDRRHILQRLGVDLYANCFNNFGSPSGRFMMRRSLMKADEGGQQKQRTVPGEGSLRRGTVVETQPCPSNQCKTPSSTKNWPSDSSRHMDVVVVSQDDDEAGNDDDNHNNHNSVNIGYLHQRLFCGKSVCSQRCPDVCYDKSRFSSNRLAAPPSRLLRQTRLLSRSDPGALSRARSLPPILEFDESNNTIEDATPSTSCSNDKQDMNEDGIDDDRHVSKNGDGGIKFAIPCPTKEERISTIFSSCTLLSTNDVAREEEEKNHDEFELPSSSSSSLNTKVKKKGSLPALPSSHRINLNPPNKMQVYRPRYHFSTFSKAPSTTLKTQLNRELSKSEEEDENFFLYPIRWRRTYSAPSSIMVDHEFVHA